MNTTLIDNSHIDDENAQDHVTISASGRLVYENSANNVNANFQAEAEPQDIPVTGIGDKNDAFPFLLVSGAGIILLIIFFIHHKKFTNSTK